MGELATESGLVLDRKILPASMPMPSWVVIQAEIGPLRAASQMTEESWKHSLALVLVYSLVDTGVKIEPLRAKCELTGVSPNLWANISATRITNGNGPIETGLANFEEKCGHPLAFEVGPLRQYPREW